MTEDVKPLALAAAELFIIAFIPVLVGGVMFSGRKQLGWATAQSRRYLYWERSFWIAGFVLLIAGFSVFAGLVQAEGENVLSRLALTGFLLGTVLIIVAEVYSLDTQGWLSYTVRLSVTLLLISQAVFGWAVLQIDLLPQWVGWATVIWNLACLVLPLRAKDPYFPAIHFILPLIAGVLLISLTT